MTAATRAAKQLRVEPMSDAYRVMLYICPKRHRDKIWNSRDGIAPLLVTCRQCGADAHRVRWFRGRRDEHHVLTPGERYFRDGTDDDARAIVARVLDRAIGTRHATPSDQRARVIEDAVKGFSRGWPVLAEYVEESVCRTA